MITRVSIFCCCLQQKIKLANVLVITKTNDLKIVKAVTS